MEVNKLEGREVLIIGFGGMMLVTLVVLSSIYVGHAITVVSNVPQPIHVMPAQPQVSVNVPNAPAPRVEVSAAAPAVNVHVPAQPAPVVNVSTPPATVTVIDQREKPKAEKPPAVLPDPVPVSVPKPDKTSALPLSKEEEVTLDSLYKNAENYISSYCVKNGVNAEGESKAWTTKWLAKVETAVRDGSVSDEQAYINRYVVDNSSSFNMDKAPPDRVVEACRVLLRYRDARLTMLSAMNEALTKENLKKTVVFLAAGVK